MTIYTFTMYLWQNFFDIIPDVTIRYISLKGHFLTAENVAFSTSNV
jgi:hypothetical protein